MTTKQWPQPAVYLMLSGTWSLRYPKMLVWLNGLSLFSKCLGPSLLCRAHMTLKKRTALPLGTKGDCVVWVFLCWAGDTGSSRRHQVLFTLRKVRRRPLRPRIFCMLGEALCEGSKHGCFGSAQCHSASLSRLDFIVRSTTKRSAGQRK